MAEPMPWESLGVQTVGLVALGLAPEQEALAAVFDRLAGSGSPCHDQGPAPCRRCSTVLSSRVRGRRARRGEVVRHSFQVGEAWREEVKTGRAWAWVRASIFEHPISEERVLPATEAN